VHQGGGFCHETGGISETGADLRRKIVQRSGLQPRAVQADIALKLRHIVISAGRRGRSCP
jgi:hypothetical protein